MQNRMLLYVSPGSTDVLQCQLGGEVAGILSYVTAMPASDEAGLIRVVMGWSGWGDTGVKLTGGAFCGKWAGSFLSISHGYLHTHLT